MLLALYSSYPQSGKTTVAQTLVKEFDAHRIAFADPGKNCFDELVWPFMNDGPIHHSSQLLLPENKDSALVPDVNVTPRLILQEFLQSMRERVHPDYWVLHAKRRILNARLVSRMVVVDDMRMPNEYAMLKKLGFLLIRVIREDVVVSRYHDSNARLDDLPFDFTINNKGTVEDLKNMTRSFVNGATGWLPNGL